MIEMDKQLEQLVRTFEINALPVQLISILTRRESSINVFLERPGVKAMILLIPSSRNVTA